MQGSIGASSVRVQQLYDNTSPTLRHSCRKVSGTDGGFCGRSAYPSAHLPTHLAARVPTRCSPAKGCGWRSFLVGIMGRSAAASARRHMYMYWYWDGLTLRQQQTSRSRYFGIWGCEWLHAQAPGAATHWLLQIWPRGRTTGVDITKPVSGNGQRIGVSSERENSYYTCVQSPCTRLPTVRPAAATVPVGHSVSAAHGGPDEYISMRRTRVISRKAPRVHALFPPSWPARKGVGRA
ncbi:hypothetical protein C2E23DRAFT_253735 [Lenzites betulinus]|nr:hypothetical protein C2E23DRAFT_253735 [Lenzites betulinus]